MNDVGLLFCSWFCFLFCWLQDVNEVRFISVMRLRDPYTGRISSPAPSSGYPSSICRFLLLPCTPTPYPPDQCMYLLINNTLHTLPSTLHRPSCPSFTPPPDYV